MSWATAWILVGHYAWYQPVYPPFKTEADCNAAAKVFNGREWPRAYGQCIEATILVKN
jgi:hypothetical protein